MQGIEEREVNGIRVVRLHYTAAEDKRAEEWPEKTRLALGMSLRDWEREMEVNWAIASGLPVYGVDFVRDFHVAKQELLAFPQLPIYRGWDFGLQPACVWCQVDAFGRLNVLQEIVTWNGRGPQKQQGIEALCPQVTFISNRDYPNAEFVDFADPAGWQKAQSDEKTCVQIMHQHGIHPRQGPMTWTARRRAMVNILTKSIGGRAAMLLSPVCVMLIEGFGGAYRFEEIGETGHYKETVEKNAWSHIMNGLEYVVGGLFSVETVARKAKPRPKHRARHTGY